MAVPDFQKLILPLLKLTSDGQLHTLGDVVDVLADGLDLSEADRNQMLPSGSQRRFDNRIGWAAFYLYKAKLLDRAARGQYRITERGLEVLKENLTIINAKYLKRFPEFVEAISGKEREDVEDEEQTQTPEETLESSYESLRRDLGRELLEKLRKCPPKFFEKVVVELIVAMGYGGSRKDVGEAVGGSGDGGIDGIIKEDKLGLDAVYVQAKRWEGNVGRPIVQAFAGSLEGYRARKGVIMTTSGFSRDAIDYVQRIEKKIVLIDGQQLCQLMIDHGVGVAEVASYVVKKLDSDYFDYE